MNKCNKVIVLSLLLSALSAQADNRDYATGCITGVVATLAVQATMVALPFGKFLWDQSKKAAKQEDDGKSQEEKEKYQEDVQRVLEETGQVKADSHHDLQKQSIDEAREKRWNEVSRILDQIVQ